ncbi:class I SAM-dependent methyltransferase [Streptomyces sp. NPDC087300]|uniref:class I SAM-dependent methyltransferase n=1 Tax=Streptomyces sp. NPDC087300 TaxID=3365780 RepID=UPI00380FC628
MTEPDFLTTTQTFYDTVASEYADRYRNVRENPLDRSMLTGFAELVLAEGGGQVADIGCGPGWVTARLHRLGLSVFGVDLSPEMLALARREHPDLRFDEGSMTGLDLPDGSLSGLVSWYSLIHIPEEQRADVLAGFHRVLAPGGHLLLGFQVGDEPLLVAEPFGHPVSLDFHRLRPERIADLVTKAGFEMQAQMERQPREAMESTPQAFLLARKPAAAA